MNTITVNTSIDIPDDYTGKVEYSNGGSEQYYLNGLLHNLNGPALIYAGGLEYYIKGVNYVKSDWELWAMFYKSASGKYYL